LLKDYSKSDWGAPELSPAQYEYAASDVMHLHNLKTVLEQELTASGLMKVARPEMSLIPVVVEMEAAGFAVDSEKLQQLLKDNETRLADALATALKEFNDDRLNLNSPAQVRAAFRRLGVEIADTAAETLATLEHPAVKALSEFRQAKKQS
jgi:DNA polymerase I-like protein with 3'-5' exonuclease and polymerase domains